MDGLSILNVLKNRYITLNRYWSRYGNSDISIFYFGKLHELRIFSIQYKTFGLMISPNMYASSTLQQKSDKHYKYKYSRNFVTVKIQNI